MTSPFSELQSKRGPVIKGPIERAEQLKDADAPLVADRSLGERTVLVILSKVTSINLRLVLSLVLQQKVRAYSIAE